MSSIVAGRPNSVGREVRYRAACQPISGDALQLDARQGPVAFGDIGWFAARGEIGGQKLQQFPRGFLTGGQLLRLAGIIARRSGVVINSGIFGFGYRCLI